MKKDEFGVHISHCCIIHGCKYINDDCPVATGKARQKDICFDCGDYGIKTVDEVIAYYKKELNVCPHCGHTLEKENEK